MLLKLIGQYWQVTTGRLSPANTPYSAVLLTIIAAIFYLVLLSQWGLLSKQNQLDFDVKLLSGMALILAYILYNYVLLRLFHIQNRFLQVMTSIFACHTIIHFLAYPVLLIAPVFSGSHLPAGVMYLVAIIYLLATILLTVWQFLVTVFIYKQALSVDGISAVLATVGLFATTIFIISTIQ